METMEDFRKKWLSSNIYYKYSGGYTINSRMMDEMCNDISLIITADRKGLAKKVKEQQNKIPTTKVCDYTNLDLRVYCDGRDDAFDEVLSLLK